MTTIKKQDNMHTDTYMAPQCEVIGILAAQVIASSDFSLTDGGSIDDYFNSVE